MNQANQIQTIDISPLTEQERLLMAQLFIKCTYAAQLTKEKPQGATKFIYLLEYTKRLVGTK